MNFPMQSCAPISIVIVPNLARSGTGKIVYTGAAYIRLILPYLSLNDGQQYIVSLSTAGELPSIGTAHVAMLHRDLAASEIPKFMAWQKSWKRHGGRIIYDLDDDLLDGPALAARGYQGDVEALADRVKAYAHAADIITVSTKTLIDRLGEFSAKCVVVPNFLDDTLWGLRNRRVIEPSPIVRIGYYGTPTHDEDLAIVAEPLNALAGEFNLSVEVVGAWGSREPTFGSKLDFEGPTIYPSFVRWLLTTARWDIGIVPMCQSNFNDTKSNLKFLEMSAIGFAIVCSDNYELRLIANHTRNSLITDNSNSSWYYNIRKLIKDRIAREKMGRRARADVISDWTIQGNRALYNLVLVQALGAEPNQGFMAGL